MFVLKIFLIILWLVAVPIVLGNKMAENRQWDACTIFLSFIMGWIKMMAIFQIIAVPAIFLKINLSTLTIIWSIIIVGGLLYNLYHYYMIRKTIRKCFWKEKSTWGTVEKIALGLVALQLVLVTFFTSSDMDDSFYVASAVTAEHTNTIFQYIGDTGAVYTQYPSRYVLSPFPIFTAMISRILQIHPAIVAHTIFPLIFIPMSYMVFYLIFRKCFTAKKSAAIGTCVICILNIWSNISVYTASTFLLTRSWQGKAILANLIFPLLTYFFIEIYQLGEHGVAMKWRDLFFTMTTTCLLSSMGIFLALLFIAIYALVFLIARRKLRTIFKIIMCCIPNFIYGVGYLILLIYMFGAIPNFA